jgi:YVTN family beta-propeller protein
MVQFFHISSIIESNHLLDTELILNLMNTNISNFTKIGRYIAIISINLTMMSCSAETNSNSHHAYITNQGEHTVSVIDTSKNQVTHTINVGKGPVGVAIASGLNRVYISNVESQDISVINTQNNTLINTIKINGSPVGLAISPDEKTLYTTDWFNNRVLAISTDNKHSVRELSIGEAPAGLAISPDNQTLYITNRDSNDIAIVDTKTLVIKQRIPVG